MDALKFITGGDRKAIMEVLSRAKCRDCGGTGEQDDAGIGDIGYNTWVCKSCDGKGWNKQAVAEIIEAANGCTPPGSP